jgi:hypothetical protein
MGTRGRFYLYVTTGSKRILVYSTYSQYDAYDWISRIKSCLKRFFVSSDGICQLSTLLDTLSMDWLQDSEFSGDTEVNYHFTVMLTDAGKIDIDNLYQKLTYVERTPVTYAFRKTGYFGDCYITQEVVQGNYKYNGQDLAEMCPPELYTQTVHLSPESAQDLFNAELDRDEEEAPADGICKLAAVYLRTGKQDCLKYLVSSYIDKLTTLLQSQANVTDSVGCNDLTRFAILEAIDRSLLVKMLTPN